ncbi:hypothetical protein [Streptomyces rapamycinicus]|uniref:Membrane protein n=2 Tax=Streptomyces rapamycinicus TaxID=1226757 RepID=A0A0A0NI67_STRRN|nr:hypothetical protein [Streptomyces rapamycinicus]AGP56669.1 membrane protein [Streptomyces rapamycinicus NRRL 5491]MBB4784274.1 hypothetical protein [Streptomyces rapamycinicus]RLV80242.1 membrane protein [Streptomyces rapamycinicus NRRL 5491]UTO64599.1 hypothetical protein LJB45_21215 [Streptomyces rapamycinicus]UTP32555.1 hypothetical protein LIV37_26340 [Streptomyces rapamycinicus NRRL 5491]
MANNPQSPNGNQDPAGSTQMFRAFVDEGTRQPQTSTGSGGGGSRVGLIVGVIAAVVIVAAVAWLALG